MFGIFHKTKVEKAPIFSISHKIEPHSFITKKELFKLSLIFIILIGFIVLINKFSKPPTSPLTRGARILPEGDELQLGKEEDKPAIKPVPFQKNDEILKEIEDDKYINTNAFFYLVHMVNSTPVQDIENSLDTKLGWENLITKQQRDLIRGKWMRVQGTLVRLLKKSYADDKFAKERGIDHLWRGEIYTPGERLYIFVITDFPNDICKEDTVEIDAVFFKVWVFETLKGSTSKAPVIIGKTLKVIPPPPLGEGWVELYWVFIFIFLTTLILIGIFTIHEKKESSEFWKRRMENKMKRRGNILKREDSNKLEEKTREKEEEKGTAPPQNTGDI